MSRLVLTAALLLALGASPVSAAEPVQVISGGVTSEEREQMEALSDGFNLRVITTTETGAYLSDVPIRVRDGQGREVLATTAVGPWLLTSLPPGRYTVSASHAGQTRERVVTVPAAGQLKLQLRFAGE